MLHSIQRILPLVLILILASCSPVTQVQSTPTEGLPTTSPQNTATSNPLQPTPVPSQTAAPPTNLAEPVVLMARDLGPPSLTAGAGHTCMLTNTGSVLCWGANQFGQLGGNDSPPINLEYAPVAEGESLDHWLLARVGGLSRDIRAISAGAYHTCALTGSGEVQCWGRNAYGQLGDGTTRDTIKPVMVDGLDGNVLSISAGATHTCALLRRGAVQCWGQNGDGQLGDGTVEDRGAPGMVKGLPATIVQISAGTVFTCALSGDGSLFCWGNGSEGRFGDGSQTNYLTAIELSELSGRVTLFTPGQYHLCAAMVSGEVWCWGALSSEEQFSPGHPLVITELHNEIAEIVAGGGHTCVLLRDGGVKCWGDNYFGQLGIGSDLGSREPVDVVGMDSRAVAIASGSVHVCALLSESGIKCWGDPSLGQLGDRAITWKWDTYTSEKFGFSLDYPAEWQVMELPTPEFNSEIDQVWFASTEFPPPQTDAQPDIGITITTDDPSPNWQPKYFDDYTSETITLGGIPATKITGANKESGYKERVVIASVGDYYLQLMPGQLPDTRLYFDRVISTLRLNGSEMGNATFSGIKFNYNLILGDLASAQTIPEFIDPSGFNFNDLPRHVRFDFSQPYSFQAPFAHLRPSGTPWQSYQDPLYPDLRPQIFVFDAEDFAALNPQAAERIDHLRSLTSAQVITPTDELPVLPLFNSTQDIRAKPLPLLFEGGSGIRFIARYAQDAVPATNPQIFYTFQGLTTGGEFYIAAYFPLYVAALPDRIEVEDWDEFNIGYRNYLVNMMSQLEGLGYEDFYPNLAMLDALVSSLSIKPAEVIR